MSTTVLMDDEAPTQTTSTTATPKHPSANTRSKKHIATPAYPEPHLESFTKPLQTYDLDEGIPMGTLDLPAAGIRKIVGKNSALEARWLHALRLAREEFDQEPFIQTRDLTRNARTLFKQELEYLNFILQGQGIQFPPETTTYYGLDTHSYHLLLLGLATKLKLATPTFENLGKKLPPIPEWTTGEEPHHLWTANDFEILAVKYRDEVENFCAYLRSVHNYEAQVPSTPPNMSRKHHLPSGFRSSQEEMGDEPVSPHTRERPPHLDNPFKSTKETIQRFSQGMDTPKHKRTENGQDLRNEGVGLLKFQIDQATQLRPKNRRLSALSNMFTNPVKMLSSNRGRELFSLPAFRSTPLSQSRPVPPSDDSSSEGSDDSSDNEGPPSNPHIPEKGKRGNDPGLRPSGDPDGGDGDPSDSEGNGNNGGKGNNPKRKEKGEGAEDPATIQKVSTSEPHFDLKLKPENVPEWDGNSDTLGRWLVKVDALGSRSGSVFIQLGVVVPTRLRKSAEEWYYSRPEEHRKRSERDWETMRDEICAYYMNRAWLDRQKSRARQASYRQHGYERETPSEYFIRKNEMLNLVFNMNNSELIMEVMAGAPSTWNSILTTHLYKTTVQFQRGIKYHEEALMRSGGERKERYQEPYKEYRRNDFERRGDTRPSARVNLVGWSSALEAPQFPKDDLTVSRGRTPEDKGARPCRYCGSGKHWDNDCKHSRKGAKKVRANFAHPTSEYLRAQADYDDMYYAESSEDESSSTEQNNNSYHGLEEDFANPLR